MSSTTPTTVSRDFREVVIEGLQKIQDAEQIYLNESHNGKPDLATFSMVIQEDKPFLELWTRIEDAGFQKPVTITINNVLHREDKSMCVVSNHEEVVVVADDQTSTKNTIRVTEPLISHANTHHGQAIDFNVTPLPSSKRAIEANCGFHASLERTPRMPDDNKLHQLPSSLGSYDLFSVESYADRLPDNIKDSGGVFFPMWQREAMWLNFRPKQHKCAVRVFMGHVNAITGQTLEESANKEGGNRKQDYIVIPGQRWLDGICVAPGVVRQFVAMPLGSGYTVEGQKTSKEKHGGLQLEITPEFLPNQRFWSEGKDKFVFKHFMMSTVGKDRVHYGGTLPESATPGQLGCRIGDILRSYPVDPACEEPLKMKHIAESGAIITCRVTYPSGFKRAYQDPRGIGNYYFRGYGLPSNAMPAPHEQQQEMQNLQQSMQEMPSPPLMAPPTAQHPLRLAPQPAKKKSLPLRNGQMHTHEITPSSGSIHDGSELRLEGRTSKRGPIEPVRPVAIKTKSFETQNIKAMGLAAGGKLIQDIYKDPYPPTTWNHAAARILHIHILDPVSCEQVTHIVPTPPSTDVKAYTEAGGGYFVVEEKVDERLDGGDFDNVKSVSQMDQHIGITTEPEFDPTKPKMCTTCELRLCDCIIRPCDHQFCNICIKRIEQNSDEDVDSARRNWKCPTCDSVVSHVAGFSAPMNLPGEEPLRVKVPVNVLKIEDGRMRFTSVQRSRV